MVKRWVEVFEDKSWDSVVNARHAALRKWVSAVNVPCCELLGCVWSGFEGQKRIEIWVTKTLNHEKKKNKMENNNGNPLTVMMQGKKRKRGEGEARDGVTRTWQWLGLMMWHSIFHVVTWQKGTNDRYYIETLNFFRYLVKKNEC